MIKVRADVNEINGKSTVKSQVIPKVTFFEKT